MLVKHVSDLRSGDTTGDWIGAHEHIISDGNGSGP
jgi:hypothetical protein